MKRRPKLDQLAECLPGTCKFTDVDGLTEVNGHFLLLEWKSAEGEIPTGQRIAFERLTSVMAGALVEMLVVAGNAETMEIDSVCQIARGRVGPWIPSSLDEVRGIIRAWADRAVGGGGR